LEDQITIVRETTSHENNRRGRHPLRVGSRESQHFFSRPLAQVTRLKLNPCQSPISYSGPMAGVGYEWLLRGAHTARVAADHGVIEVQALPGCS
jgi:hypothetical protein